MPRQKQKASTSAKMHIIEAAAAIFYKSGYRATGVNEIAKAAGITKATLYHHFENKDDLIEATIRHLSAYHRAQYEKCWKTKRKPLEKLTALFDAMGKSFDAKDFYGCPFINVAGEYTDHKAPARIVAQEHYAYLTQHLEKFAIQAELKRPREVAEQITTLLAGAYSGWYVAGNKQAAKQAKALALSLIQVSL